jgi:hypothetical protein
MKKNNKIIDEYVCNYDEVRTSRLKECYLWLNDSKKCKVKSNFECFLGNFYDGIIGVQEYLYNSKSNIFVINLEIYLKICKKNIEKYVEKTNI